MARIVRLSKKASVKFDNIIEHLKSEWSEKVKDEFILKLDKAMDHLAQFPASHPKSETIKGLHRYVITRQTTIFYRFNKNVVTIVTLFDNRQDPNKIKEETK